VNAQVQQKIIQFLDKMLIETSNFRLHVLESLGHTFGLQHSIFWLFDKQGNFTQPVFINIKDSCMDEYQGCFYWEDVLNPHNIKNHLPHNNVFTVKNVMSWDEYENTKYYDDFMRRYNYYDEILIYLTSGNSLIGAIGIGLQKNNTFDIGELKGLEVVSKHISKTLAGKLFLDDITYQNLVMEASSNQLPVGMVAFDESFKILHLNHTAQDIFLALKPHKDITDMQCFLDSFLGHYPSWQTGLADTIITENSNRILLHIVPESIKNNKAYILFLVPESILVKKELLKANNNPYNLSKRELEIVKLVMQGFSNQDIAGELFISLHTVKTHLQNIFNKVGVTNRTALCYKLCGMPI
jgi:DNA-binding CsgD family transcriptional regulator